MKNADSCIISMQGLASYCAGKSAIPLDGNQAYVVNFQQSVISEKQVFCVTMSTPNLKKKQGSSAVVHVDTTYKLTWMGFPIMVSYC